MKFDFDIKQAAVRDYLDGVDGYKLIARHHGIPEPSLRAWVAAYQIHGDDALLPTRHCYTDAFRLEVVNTLHHEHLSVRAVAARFNIPDHKTVRSWIARAAAGLLEPGIQEKTAMNRKPAHRGKPPEDMTPEQLIDEVLFLRAEKAYLEKLDALMKENDLKRPKKKQPSSGR
ncbi:helix-turn-helix domain-containing protein [Pantoea sp. A4]|uniref:helix-turn-helix domain-containing protein n=1 Tax=Pantoea sp. A4 TaxID=1225184 RepID=UPI00037897D3|nr:helix-turn-helix domain-containing protein [Pantoea sp. A4]